MAVFCVLYYVLSFCQSVPCIIKILKTKRSNDYSLLNRALQYTALLCWTIYLFSLIIAGKEQLYLGIIGIVDFLLLTSENIIILRYYNFKGA